MQHNNKPAFCFYKNIGIPQEVCVWLNWSFASFRFRVKVTRLQLLYNLYNLGSFTAVLVRWLKGTQSHFVDVFIVDIFTAFAWTFFPNGRFDRGLFCRIPIGYSFTYKRKHPSW